MARLFGGIMSVSIIGSFGRCTQFNYYAIYIGSSLASKFRAPQFIFSLGTELPIIDSGNDVHCFHVEHLNSDY